MIIAIDRGWSYFEMEMNMNCCLIECIWNMDKCPVAAEVSN